MLDNVNLCLNFLECYGIKRMLIYQQPNVDKCHIWLSPFKQCKNLVYEDFFWQTMTHSIELKCKKVEKAR